MFQVPLSVKFDVPCSLVLSISSKAKKHNAHRPATYDRAQDRTHDYPPAMTSYSDLFSSGLVPHTPRHRDYPEPPSPLLTDPMASSPMAIPPSPVDSVIPARASSDTLN